MTIPPFPVPHFSLGARVRYRNPLGVWRAEAYRVVSCAATHAVGLEPVVQYMLVPWEGSGDWALDRPISSVFEQDVAAWPEEPTCQN